MPPVVRYEAQIGWCGWLSHQSQLIVKDLFLQKLLATHLAEQWYKKALEIFERLGHPPLMVITLAQLGVLRRAQERWQESVAWFGKALAIAVEYQMRIAEVILHNLALVMEDIGENEFVAVWQQAFGDAEPPLDELREAVKQLEE